MWGAANAIRVDGRALHLTPPGRPAADVAPLLLWDDPIPDNPIPIVMTSLARPEDRMWMAARIMDRRRPVRVGLLHRIADTVVLNELGWRRWEAKFLWSCAYSMWHEVDGDLQARGVNVAGMPAAAATNAVFGVIRGWYQQGDRKDYEKFMRDLERKPPRVIIAEIEGATDEDFAAEARAGSAAGQIRERTRDTSGDSVIEVR